MFRNVLVAVIMVAAIAGAVGPLGLLSVVAQENGPSATRSISPTSVAPGGEVTVTITVANYGSFGGVHETLPDGFTYLSSSGIDNALVDATGNPAKFTLFEVGDASFTYTVTASSEAGPHSFSGILKDSDQMEHMVGGASMVTVVVPATPTPTPDPNAPSAVRSISPMSVAPGGEVMVTITVANYGGFGRVTETLPDGFGYVSSSGIDNEQVNVVGDQAKFTLQADDSFTYTVTAASTEGSYRFSGELRDSDRMNYTVGGASAVMVQSAAPPPPPPPAPTPAHSSYRPGRDGDLQHGYAQGWGHADRHPERPRRRRCGDDLAVVQVRHHGRDLRQHRHRHVGELHPGG